MRAELDTLAAMRRFLSFVLLAALAGCHQAPTQVTKPTAAVQPPPPSSGGGGVAPIASGAATGLTPMAGSESVEGAGMGGIGQSAKDAARRAAGQSSAPADTTGSGE